ncbi:hypothetical protein ACFJIS_19450 [Variovorax boronicumulans]|uniref:hypothetical protein n=1 Tax=Variovorax boronicumulans TaxID=436515 RepID=UPI0036F40CCF
MTLLWWVVFHALDALFWLWILRWGAEGLRMFALLMLIVCAISFVWGLLMPEMRCWYSGHC